MKVIFYVIAIILLFLLASCSLVCQPCDGINERCPASPCFIVND